MIRPTHLTQPYRKGMQRPPGPSLYAMLRGRTLYGHNPMDLQRMLQARRRLY